MSGDAMIAGRLETVDIKDIHPYHRNPRNNLLAIEKVMESISEYGYQSPIIVDADHTIIVGHSRYEALRQLGYETIAVLVADMPPEKAAQYRLIDNKTSEFATWNSNLQIELGDAFALDPDVLSIFFPNIDLSAEVPSQTDHLAVQAANQVLQDTRDADRAGTRERADRAAVDDAPSAPVYVEATCPECEHTFSVKVR